MIKLFKLTTGETVIARVKEETEGSIYLEKPATIGVVPNNKGDMMITLIPFMLGAKKDASVSLAKSQIVAEVNDAGIDHLVKSQYLQAVTGLVLAGPNVNPDQDLKAMLNKKSN